MQNNYKYNFQKVKNKVRCKGSYHLIIIQNKIPIKLSDICSDTTLFCILYVLCKVIFKWEVYFFILSHCYRLTAVKLLGVFKIQI